MDQSSTSIVALATTVHLCLAALRNHRQRSRGVSSLALVSLSQAALPWLFPTPFGLAAGIVFHLAWFAACEWLARPLPVAAPLPPPPVAARPAQAPARPKGFVAAPIVATCDETADIKTIRILRPDGFDFEPGQFLTVRLRIDGQEYARCYSISSPPSARGYLEISVKRQGLVSNALHATARAGSTLSVRAPVGGFTYPKADDRPLVLVAGGIGVTPLMSMLRHACATDPTRPITLIYGVRSARDIAFRDELRSIARRNPQVRMSFAASREATQPDLYPGRIDDALVSSAAPDIAHSLTYVCGPRAMIDGVRQLLRQRDIPASQLRYERFEAAIAASARTDAGPAEEPPSKTRVHTLTCATSGRRVQARPDQTLLEAVEAGGIEIASLCRSGVCGTCRIQVTAGDARCTSAALDDEDRAAGFVLACVTTLHGDCTVNA